MTDFFDFTVYPEKYTLPKAFTNIISHNIQYIVQAFSITVATNHDVDLYTHM